ncbi:lysylphosphatidylglycerol synthase transmembrane domain-containing protein [Pontibacter cellulosilyticus]|uniref:Flippase-like domain-containing protein n=1 Tax=Pontibacter cellulosilyticus TaxID=1720253 RepID=A0A923N4S1_9BACT|nr:lysylphosphatidylglycerol synthase transmembrane domain-containing protein [Pontibacter cellulosilyticus]MBC5992208.1 flippase-like domain-containing protein [Pontibacter cellulosilyticus]
MALTKESLQAKFSTRKLILPMLLGLGVVGYMLYQNYEPGQVQTLLQASPFWLGMALLVLLVRDYGYVHRIRYVTEKQLTLKQSFQVIMLWEFASCALPSVVGGTTVAAYILFKEGIALGKSIAQVMVTAMLDNLYFVLAVPLVLLFAKGQILPELEMLNETVRQSLGIAFVISYLLIALYAFTMFYALFINPKAIKRLLIRLGQLGLFNRWRQTLFRHANELLIASGHLRSKSMNYWLHASISTAFVWTARYAIIGCFIAAFTELSIADHFIVFARNLVYKIVLLISITPGGAGFAEIAFPAFFGAFLGSFTTIIVLLYRLLTYYLYLIAGTLVFPRWVARVYTSEANSTTPDITLKSNSTPSIQMAVGQP